MKVILIKNVPGLGSTGDMVEVKPGFARNYLIPQKMAMAATVGNVKALDHEKRIVAVKVEQERKAAASLQEKIEQAKISIARHAGEGDKLFGSVTNRDIADSLRASGIEIDHRIIKLEEPIKTLGEFSIPVKLHASLTAKLSLVVVPTEQA